MRLDRHARLRHRVERWSKRIGVEPRLLRIQRMTQKWGSCSTKGIVTLAVDLVARPRGFQDFVIVHELLHLRVPNHGKLFKALMSAYVADWRRQDIHRKSRPLRSG